MRTYTTEEFLSAVGKRIGESSLRTVAKEFGISAAYLSDIMRGKRQVSDNVAAMFGFERVVKTEVFFRTIYKS